MASPALAVQDVIDALDSFYCHNVVAALWADAVANRLEGLAIYLLSEELPEVADHARAAARRLAGRIGEAAGSPATPGSSSTAHRARTSSRSPTARTPRAITTYALRRLDIIIAAYQAFLDMARGRDDVSFALVVGLLSAETHRRADVTAALAGQ